MKLSKRGLFSLLLVILGVALVLSSNLDDFFAQRRPALTLKDFVAPAVTPAIVPTSASANMTYIPLNIGDVPSDHQNEIWTIVKNWMRNNPNQRLIDYQTVYRGNTSQNYSAKTLGVLLLTAPNGYTLASPNIYDTATVQVILKPGDMNNQMTQTAALITSWAKEHASKHVINFEVLYKTDTATGYGGQIFAVTLYYAEN